MTDKRGWLSMMDVRTWRDNIAHGHVAFHVFDALHSVGALERLREAGPAGIELEALAKACGVDAFQLAGGLGYVTLSDEVIGREGDRYWLTEKGKEWLFAPPFLNMIFKLRAYQMIHTHYLQALLGKERYGKDFVREGQSVARFSEIGTRPMNPWIAEVLTELGSKTVVDLGCGAAHMLIHFCQLNPGLRGVGVDISEGSLTEARAKIAEAGMQDSIRVAQGDLTKPESFAGQVGDADTFTCMAALHEFLRDGREAMVSLLREMSRVYKGRHLIVMEFCWVTDDRFAEMPIPDRIPLLYYQYIMHPLSLQGLPVDEAAWRSIFRDAGLTEVKVETVMFPFVGFVLKL